MSADGEEEANRIDIVAAKRITRKGLFGISDIVPLDSIPGIKHLHFEAVLVPGNGREFRLREKPPLPPSQV
jgi:hypothetical protein